MICTHRRSVQYTSAATARPSAPAPPAHHREDGWSVAVPHHAFGKFEAKLRALAARARRPLLEVARPPPAPSAGARPSRVVLEARGGSGAVKLRWGAPPGGCEDRRAAQRSVAQRARPRPMSAHGLPVLSQRPQVGRAQVLEKATDYVVGAPLQSASPASPLRAWLRPCAIGCTASRENWRAQGWHASPSADVDENRCARHVALPGVRICHTCHKRRGSLRSGPEQCYGGGKSGRKSLPEAGTLDSSGTPWEFFWCSRGLRPNREAGHPEAMCGLRIWLPPPQTLCCIAMQDARRAAPHSSAGDGGALAAAPRSGAGCRRVRFRRRLAGRASRSGGAGRPPVVAGALPQPGGGRQRLPPTSPLGPADSPLLNKHTKLVN